MEPEKTLREVRAYYFTGIGHVQGASIIHERLLQLGVGSTDASWVALQHILGFATEAALKAYLASSGVKRRALRTFGHNLSDLYAEALRADLEDAGKEVGQPELASALGRFVELCGEDYTSYNYRYLERASHSVLHSGTATRTVIRAIFCILEIVDRRSTFSE